MRVKVIKEIKGLVPGDILYYNDKTDTYEITKTDYDIGDKTQSVRSIRVIISSYTVEEHKDYFVFIDDDNNDMEINKIYYRDFPEDDNNSIKKSETPVQAEPEVENTISQDSEISKLQEQLKELEKKLEDIERSKSVNQYPFYPIVKQWMGLPIVCTNYI